METWRKFSPRCISSTSSTSNSSSSRLPTPHHQQQQQQPTQTTTKTTDDNGKFNQKSIHKDFKKQTKNKQKYVKKTLKNRSKIGQKSSKNRSKIDPGPISRKTSQKVTPRTPLEKSKFRFFSIQGAPTSAFEFFQAPQGPHKGRQNETKIDTKTNRFSHRSRDRSRGQFRAKKQLPRKAKNLQKCRTVVDF